MKILLEYDAATGQLKDIKGLAVTLFGAVGFEIDDDKAPVLELIKQGVTPDEIIKLKNNDLL